MHTRAAPKQKLLDPGMDGRMVADVELFLRERIALALERGVAFEQLDARPRPRLRQDAGPDVEVLRALPRAARARATALLAVSRKDFIGAITRRPPRERLAGTLAAIGHGVDAGAHICASTTSPRWPTSWPCAPR